MLTDNDTVLPGIVPPTLEKRAAVPSSVKRRPGTGTLLPAPIVASTAASAGVIVPNRARPSASGGATAGTRRSQVIHPSYQPDSLLMTNRPEMSVNMSMNARGSAGLVGRPGFGSSVMRTAPSVGRPPLAKFAPVGITPLSLMPATMLVNTFGGIVVVSSR